MDVKDFEFSQNHLLFWDKLEKANFWLEAIIATADRDVDDRTVAHLLRDPIEDGGQWNMFVALVRKHGLVPKSGDAGDRSVLATTRQMNRDLRHVLRQAARDLRDRRGRRRRRRGPARAEGAGARGRSTGCSASTSARRRSGLVAVEGQGQAASTATAR